MSAKHEIVKPETLPSVVWRESRVITTEFLASLYGTDVDSIRHNFSRNSQRFEQGKHYHKLEGNDLAAFKNSMTDSHVVQKRAKSLYLWTERGAARHAKMLETDQAWDVFEKLEDCYFHRRGQTDADATELSTVRDRTPLYHGAVDIVITHRLSFGNAYQALNYFAGVQHFPEMTKQQVAETAGFLSRLLTGGATQKDFQRIATNQVAITGESSQMHLGLTIPLLFGGKHA